MRRLALASALLWTAGFLVLYLVVTSREDGPTWVYAILLAVVMVLLGVAVTGSGGGTLPVVAASMLAAMMLLGILSVGLLLLPAVLATGVAVFLPLPPRHGGVT